MHLSLKWLNFGASSAKSAGAAEATGGGGDGVGPICIGSVDGWLRAEIARTYLEQAGIGVHLQPETVGSVYGFVSGPLAAVYLWVPASQAEEATRLFAELDFGEA